MGRSVSPLAVAMVSLFYLEIIIMSNAANTTVSSKHFDLHVSGLGYLNRIREVKVRKGSPFWACSVNALHGDSEDPAYTRFDLIVRGLLAVERIKSLQDSVESKKKVLIAFKLGDIYPDLFVYEYGERKGQNGVAIKGRLLQVGFASIDGIPVDWTEAGIPEPDAVAA